MNLPGTSLGSHIRTAVYIISGRPHVVKSERPRDSQTGCVGKVQGTCSGRPEDLNLPTMGCFFKRWKITTTTIKTQKEKQINKRNFTINKAFETFSCESHHPSRSMKLWLQNNGVEMNLINFLESKAIKLANKWLQYHKLCLLIISWYS